MTESKLVVAWRNGYRRITEVYRRPQVGGGYVYYLDNGDDFTLVYIRQNLPDCAL